MKDYSGYDRIEDFTKYSKNVLMQNQLKYEGQDLLVDGVLTRGIIRNDQNPMSETKEDRSFIVDVSTSLKSGSYVNYDGLDYIIVTKIDTHKDYYKKCKIRECNQHFNLKGWDKPIPCWGDNTSYGVKGKIDTNYFTTTDGKFQFKIQKNKYTDMLDKDIRLIFNHKYAYKIVECENIKDENIYVITVEKDEILAKDDLINNIAYNSSLEVETPVNPNPNPSNPYNIIADNGDLSLKRYNPNTFRMVDSYGNNVGGTWTITIDYNDVLESNITIKETGTNYIKLVNNKGYNALPIKITFKKDLNLLTQEVRLVN